MGGLRGILLFLPCLLLELAPGSQCLVADVTRDTSLGVIVGQVEEVQGLLVQTFKGIPYALPPTQSLRWKNPVPAPPFASGRFVASSYGPSCPNAAWAPSPLCKTCSTRTNYPRWPNSEDCLYLNIMTPQNAAPGSNLPVMVFVHGGGGTVGVGSAYSNSSTLVGNNTIYITLNYRLGILGWLAHDQLALEQDGVSGNYAVRDVILALQWVQEHISNFGGDPSRVTVFGQSYGGTAIHHLLVTPLANGLFSGVIAESGDVDLEWPSQHEVEAVVGKALLQGLGCSDIGCARSKGWEEVLGVDVQQVNPCVNAIDALAVFPRTPIVALLHGDVNRVAGIYGHNLQEGHLNDYFSQKPYDAFVAQYQDDADLFNAAVKDMTSPAHNASETAATVHWELETLYPRSSALPNNYERLCSLATDLNEAFAGIVWAKAMARWHRDSYCYIFCGEAEGSVNMLPFGSMHLLELAQLLNDTSLFDGHEPTQSEIETGQTLVDLWTSFATDREPFTRHGVAWPRVAEAEGSSLTMHILADGKVRVSKNWHEDQFALVRKWKQWWIANTTAL